MIGLHVAMIAPYYFPVRGGITSFVGGLTRALRAEGAHVSVIVRDGDSGRDTVVIRRDPRAFARDAARALEGLRPDAVHAHAHWYALRAALRGAGGARVIFSFHTAWPRRDPLRAFALNRMLSQCTAVTFPSRHLRSVVATRTPDSLVSIVPPGTDEAHVDRDAGRSFVASLANPDWSATVGYVGKFEWPAKVAGFRILLQALDRPELEGVGLVAAGGGTHFPTVEREVTRLGLLKRVRLLGDVADPGPIYAGCDIYCHPSLQEGMSQSVLEAMRAGAPIVGFRLPFMEEVIDDGVHGLLVPEGPGALASGIARVLRDREFSARLGAAAQARARAEYDWRTIAGRFLDLYGGAAR